MFNRVRDALARALYDRALAMARDRGPYIDPARVTPTGPGHVTGVQPEPVRYPTGHSTGPPHVGSGEPPAPGPCPEPETVTCAGRVRLVGRSGCGCG